MKYRNLIIIFGAVVCFIEFIFIDWKPPEAQAMTVGVLHMIASAILAITLVLYVSTWRIGWTLLIRIIFFGIIALMLVYSFRSGYRLLF